MSFSRSLLIALAVCAASAFAGCAARSVHSFVERGTDLSQYHTFAWGPADRGETGDPRLDDNEIVQGRIQAAIEKQLAARGFQTSGANPPDVRVHYHMRVEQKVDLSHEFDPITRAPEPCTHCAPSIYDAGSLVVDLVDVRSHELIWRGWSEGSVDGVVDNQRWLNEQIDQSVKRIFDQLPRSAR